MDKILGQRPIVTQLRYQQLREHCHDKFLAEWS